MVGFGPTIWSRQGRDRVRREGRAARRLHPDDRHVPARARCRPDELRDVVDRPLQPSSTRRAPLDGGGAAGRRGPGVLQAGRCQEDHHHARRPDHEPASSRPCCSPVSSRSTALPQVAPKVGLLSKCVPTARRPCRSRRPTCAAGDPQSPAIAAGLKAGDRILSVDGRADHRVGRGLVGDPREPGPHDGVGRAARRRAGRSRSRPPMLQAGRARRRRQAGQADGQLVLRRRASPASPPRRSSSAPRSPARSSSGTALSTPPPSSCASREKMTGVMQAAFGSGERDPNGPISVVGVGRIGGEVAASTSRPTSGDNWPQARPARAAHRRAQPRPVRLQPDPVAAAGRRPRRGRRCGRAIKKRRGPACGTGPTPATSTSPRGCPSRTACRSCYRDVRAAHLRRHRQADRHLRLTPRRRPERGGSRARAQPDRT